MTSQRRRRTPIPMTLGLTCDLVLSTVTDGIVSGFAIHNLRQSEASFEPYGFKFCATIAATIICHPLKRRLNVSFDWRSRSIHLVPGHVLLGALSTYNTPAIVSVAIGITASTTPFALQFFFLQCETHDKIYIQFESTSRR